MDVIPPPTGEATAKGTETTETATAELITTDSDTPPDIATAGFIVTATGSGS